jgi:hypothetical protein
MDCIFCKKTFSSRSSLNNHQKTTKYCLKLQGKKYENKNFNCEYCYKTFTTKQYLINHLQFCNVKKEKDIIKKKDDELKNKLLKKEKDLENKFLKKEKEFEIKLKEKDDEINRLKELNAELRGKLTTFKEDHEFIKEIAKQPKNTTNNTTNNTLNIKSCIDFNNVNKIKDVIDNDFNIKYAIEGQKGLARFVTEKLLTDDNGNLIYVCTDPSRQIFKYKDVAGEIKKDVEAKKLTNYIVDGGIKNKVVDIAGNWYKDDNGNIDIDKFNIMVEQQQNILKLKDDNNSFKKELATITTQ